MEIKAYQVIMGRKHNEHIPVDEAYQKAKNITENGQRVKDVL